MGKKEIGFLILSFLFTSCAGVPRFTNVRQTDETSNTPSVKQEPAPDKDLNSYDETIPLDILTGTASYYAEPYNGRRTSDGEIYDMNSLTAAQQDLPFNTIVRVTNLGNQKSVILRINDRGFLKKGRIIDVSLEAAKRLGMVAAGTANVRIDVLKYGDSQK